MKRNEDCKCIKFRNPVRRTIFLWISIWGLITSTVAQVSFKSIIEHYNFSAITINDGLPHNYIDNIYKDSQGFLWLCTHNGLSRFDGTNFVNYNISSEGIRLRSNFVNGVCEDEFHRLWIASEAGLDLLNLKTGRFESIDYSVFQSEDLSKIPILFLLKDRKGNLWIATQTNLYQIQLGKDGKIKRSALLFSTYDKHSAPITALGEVGNEVWVGYDRNVYKVETAGKNKMSLRPIFDKTIFDEQSRIHCFCVYNKEIWIGTNRGLYRYNQKSYQHKHYTPNDEKAYSLTESYITGLAVTANNELVISSLKGINFYNPKSDNFVQMESAGEFSGSSINFNLMNCLLADGAILWIGTELNGLIKMVQRNLNIELLTYGLNQAENRGTTPVGCVFEDTNGNLWISNIGKGVGVKIHGSDSFIRIYQDFKNPNSLSHNSVNDIKEDDRNQLWFATWGGGLNSLKMDRLISPTFTRYNVGNSSLKSDFIGSLCFDNLNLGMWVGTAEGLSFFDLQKQTFTNLALPTDRLPNNSLVGMLIDRKQRLWIGTHHGLIVLDLYSFARNRKDIRYHYFEYKLDDPGSKLIEKISCICEAADGTIWLGSNGYGLYKISSDRISSENFQNMTVKDGLPDNTIYGIVEDLQHRLWISTNKGLSCLNVKSGHFANYYEQDGLPSDQFYWNSYCRSREGMIYFGGLNGAIGLKGVNRVARKHPRIVFTQLIVQNNIIRQGGNGYLSQSISWAKEVHLHERDKSFSVEFTALDFENPEKYKYFYRLKGFDDRWIECDPKHHYASYTNLKSGHYALQVKVQSLMNSEDEQTAELAIFVAPFFYKTWWFYLIVLLVVALLFYAYLQWKISTYKQQKTILTEKVKERTVALEEKMEALSRQNNLLVEQKEQLIELSEKIQEITADKISFFTNITHEFRTPITLILGPISRALKLSQNPSVIEQLRIVDRNSKSLLGLVNQLLDFRKVESGHISVAKKMHNLHAFIDENIALFQAFSGERNIEIRCYTRLKKIYYCYDEGWIQKVLVNLISNALKFTPDGGKISFYACSIADGQQQEKLYLSVSDTGIGIQPNDLEKIFDRFYQSANIVQHPIIGQSGTGIGLYLCKRIIEEHGGRIFALNNKKSGSSVRIVMPVPTENSDEVYHPDNISDYLFSIPQPSEYEIIDAESVASSTSKKTILIVDDNRDMRTYVRSVLSVEYHVLEAGGGEEALKCLNQHNVDFIVTDLMMPVMDGLEFSKRVKENISISHIPILILTAKISDDVKLESFKIGVDEYMQKPLNEELLLVRIHNIFSIRQNNQQEFAMQMDPALLNMDEESNDNRFLNRAMQVLEKEYKDAGFDVNAFSEAMNMSKTLLNQKLQNIVGQSTGKFIGNYRLKKARDLILINKLSKNMNISEIAFEIGFSDPKYFSRCFQKKYGMLPSTLILGGNSESPPE
jgi:signal transduction histidine kinase/ligand-binding sensor domain-containing protein/CheY-like chemotaxis protein/AraC-like DNA-binding protein